MIDLTCRLLVLGAGPGGYVCAIRAGQLGLDTIIVDAGPPGGTCLNVGCIPSKALIHAADEFHRLRACAAGASPFGILAAAPTIDLSATVAWKDAIVARLTGGVAGLMKAAGVRFIAGNGYFLDGKTVRVETAGGAKTIRAETIVIATGSAPVELPGLTFGGRILSSTEALSLTKVPDSLAVVGGGYIGLEIGTAYAKLGSRVTVIEAMERVLPLYDEELVRPVARRLAELGVDMLTGSRTTGFDQTAGVLAIQTPAGPRDLACERVLVAAGRRPLTNGWGIEELRLAMDERFLRVDNRCRTSMFGVYAIGDVTGEPMLAHRAMAQGEMVAEIVAGKNRAWDRRSIPAICFTDPEIVNVGLSPGEARAQGLEVTVASFPFTANGRAMTMGDDAGFVRIVCRADNRLVLGIAAVGAGVSELSAAFGLAIETGCVAEDIAATIHAHPTRGEALQEAAAAVLGQAIHFRGRG